MYLSLRCTTNKAFYRKKDLVFFYNFIDSLEINFYLNGQVLNIYEQFCIKQNSKKYWGTKLVVLHLKRILKFLLKKKLFLNFKYIV